MPTATLGGLTFSRIAALGSGTCARTSAGALYCWGAGGLGQNGDSTTSPRGTPTAVNWVEGTARALAVTTQPSGGVSLNAWGTQIVVAVKDGVGTTMTGATNAVSLALVGGTGAVLTCTSNPVVAVNGVATFGGCKVDKAGTYTLSATSTGLGSATSNSFSITPGAASLTTSTITASPTSISATGVATSTLTVQLKDASGNALTTSGGTVTVVKTAGPTVSLSAVTDNNDGTYTATVSGSSAGTATFSAQLGGTALTHSSNPVSVTLTAGTATQLAVTTQPGGGTSQTAWSTQPVVAVRDATGNLVTSSTASVTLALVSGGGAVLSCTSNPVVAVNGVATFGGCKVDKAGTYTLSATSTGLGSATSNSVSVVAGAPNKLAFSVQPTSAQSLAYWSGQPAVMIQDAASNITSSTDSVSVELTSPGGATLYCAASKIPAVNGVATFSGCHVDKAGTYTLTARSGSLATGQSTSFSITPGTASVSTSTLTASQSSITANNTATSTLTVQLKDVSGNALTASGGTVTIVQTNGPSLTLSAVTDNNNGSYTATVKGSVAGTATFSAQLGGTTLTHSSNPVTVTLTPGAATQISIYAGNNQSSTVGTAVGTVPTVLVVDANSNKVPGVSVTFAVASGGGSGTTLTTTTNSNGLASPGSWTLGTTAGVNTMTATATGLTGSPLTFSDTAKAGATTQIASSIAASGAPAGSPFTTQPSIQVKDTYGNLTSQGTVTMTVSGGDGQATVVGTSTLAASNGYANFTNVGITGTAGTSYTLTFTSGSYTVTQSITAATGPAAKLIFSQQASGVNLGADFTVQPLIDVQDAGNNYLNGATGYVTISINNGASFYGTPVKTVAVSSGMASFTGIGLASGTPTGTYTLSYKWTDSQGNPTGSIPILTQTITVP